MEPPESTTGQAPSADVRWRRKLFGLTTAALTAGAVALGTPAAAAPAEGTIRDAGTAEVVPDSYVVVLKSDGASVSSRAGSLAGKYGASVKHTYDSALRGFSATMSEARAKRLAADPAVDYVQRDGIFRINGVQPNPPSWGLDRVDQRNLPLDNSYTYPTAASAVHAYVLDTGINVNHNDFGGRAVHGRDTVNNDNDASDCHGHGTHVAGTVGGSSYGVAKGVTLVAVRVLNCQGSGTTAGIVAGIDWVTANAVKPAVANMSLGGGTNTTLDDAVARSIASGIQYSLAAGNGDIFGNPQNACSFSPARTPNAITVGATQRTDARASFSNFGTCLDIFAPGVGITSAWYTSNTATNTISGTSMAAPHVAGAAAMVLAANPGFTPQQVRDALVGNATEGVVTDARTGSPNRLLFVGAGGTEPPPPPPPPGCAATNANNVNIPDNNTNVFSDVAISGCNRNASATTTVEVHVVHTWRGDIVLDLIAPDGTAYRLKNNSSGDSADNINATYTVNASSEAANGTWRLRARDVYRLDTGYIDSWTLTV
jgi:subtilisin family serine protease